MACQKFIENKQKQDSTFYTDFKLLVDKMYEVQMKEEKAKDLKEVIPTKEKIKQFLIDEKELPTW